MDRHHALLIQAIDGMGDDALVWGVSRWLMCQQPQGLKSCGQCHGCQLMQANTHPDWYRLEAEKGKASLGIDAVRDVSEAVPFCPAGWRENCLAAGCDATDRSRRQRAPENAGRAARQLLVFLSVREPSRLLATLRSRCMTWHLSPPEETHSLQWLQKQQPQPEAILRAALRLSNGAPAAALTLLQPDRWQARQTLCDSLNSALSGDILQLLPALNSDDVAVRLGWLLSLLVDAMKVQQGASNWLSNGDRPDVVTQLAQQFSTAR